MTSRELPKKKYGRWRVLEYAGYKMYRRPNGEKYKYHFWKCRCGCGKVRKVAEIPLKQLRTKQCRSCGSRKGPTTHGLFVKNMGGRTPEYNAWSSVVNNSSVPVYPGWQGRDGFANFMRDLGERPSNNHRLERINKPQGWTPENTHWRQYRDGVKLYEYQGEKYTLGELAFIADMDPGTMYYRLKKYSPEIAVKAKIQVQRTRVK